MYERYKVLKKLYPDYLILIYKKNKLISFNKDKDIIDIFGVNSIYNTNKIILNNLDIDVMDTYENNKYEFYYIKALLIKCLERIKHEKENSYYI